MEAMDGIPPQIPGYIFAQKLGSGSEANVYLYQQLSPSRQVAIKISKGMLDPSAAARFRSEANFMGKISSHPYILSVYESGVTTTGNGYTVFEYAPEAITRPSWNPTVSTQTRCSPSASI